MSTEIRLDLEESIANALIALRTILKKERALTLEDSAWLESLCKTFKTQALPFLTASDKSVNLLAIDELLKEPDQKVLLEKLEQCLSALHSANFYRPTEFDIEGLKLSVHCTEVGDLLRGQYAAEEFEKLFDFCLVTGVFAQNIDEANGLVRTAEADSNWEMSGRQWVTDTVRCGAIEQVNAPKAWVKALLTLVNFYNQPTEIEAIIKSIADPDWYRKGGLTNGVAHIFLPKTLERDHNWFNNKRLESHALALDALCKALFTGLTEESEAGLNTYILDSGDNFDKVVNAISGLAAYLKAINTDPNSLHSGKPVFDFNAPSAGAWEELPFPGGLTWDIEAMRAAFESLKRLLFEKTSETLERLENVRSAITATEFGGWLKTPDALNQLIESAERKVLDRLFEGATPMEHPKRPADSSLSFITTSSIILDKSIVKDVERQYQLLEFLEERLVKANGMIRYEPFIVESNGASESAFDAYLADNYWLFPSLRGLLNGTERHSERQFGSTDSSTPEEYMERVHLARKDTEAQWCWVSVVSEGYSRQVAKLIAVSIQENRCLSDSELTLLKKGHAKATEFINRSYARITGLSETDNPVAKANGENCPAFAIPEAFECVTSVVDPDQKVFLPGANTPLAWAQASLFNASKLFAQNLASLAELDLG